MRPVDYFGPLMDEFFAESEEHIVFLRRALLYLDENDRASPLAGEQLRNVLRSLHTLKGLAGMVGFSEAERLAHGLEEWVRQASAGDSLPGDLSLDTMFEGTGLLEKVLAARRSAGPAIDIDDFIARHAPGEEETPTPTPSGSEGDAEVGGLSLTAAEHYRLDAAVERKATILRVEYTPSPELVGRGVGVEAVRGRLTRIGDIVHASPRVLPGRGVAFRFLVALAEGAEPAAEWRDEGIEWTPVDASTVAARRPGSATTHPQSGAAPGPDPQALSQTVVRVDLARLDDLMRLIGDMVLSRAKLDDLVSSATAARGIIDLDALEQLNATFERQLRDLRNGVMRVRLVPIGDVFERMRFVVRDLAPESGDRVRVESHGRGTEIDKLVVERMMEPMLHLVRNAVSHGIEPPEERTARGKPAEGLIRLAAVAAGDRITITIEDDGRGIDRTKVAKRARAAGLPVAAPLDDEALLDLLCTPGFSTSEQADRASGRGIGMDVVRSTTRALGGELFLTSEPGKGSCFTIELPLTLMIVDALLVRLAGEIMAVPQPALLEILQVAEAEIVRFENNEIIRYRGRVLPVIRLREVFGMRDEGVSRGVLTILVVGSRGEPVGLAVDAAVGLREIVVRSLGDPLVTVRGVSGATELGDGRVCLILDSAELVRLAAERRGTPVRSIQHPHV